MDLNDINCLFRDNWKLYQMSRCGSNSRTNHKCFHSCGQVQKKHDRDVACVIRDRRKDSNPVNYGCRDKRSHFVESLVSLICQTNCFQGCCNEQICSITVSSGNCNLTLKLACFLTKHSLCPIFISFIKRKIYQREREDDQNLIHYV